MSGPTCTAAPTQAPLQPEDSDSELELRHRGLWRGSTGSLVSMPSMSSARLDDVEYMQWRVCWLCVSGARVPCARARGVCAALANAPCARPLSQPSTLCTPLSQQERHPCVLEHFSRFLELVDGKRVAVFLDYDGASVCCAARMQYTSVLSPPLSRSP